MKKYILSIDQGTTSSRAILFDNSGVLRHIAQKPVSLIYPHAGWVEVDAISIWLSVVDVINAVLTKANVGFEEIDSIGITNQRETTVVWDKKTGMPVYNAIVWQSNQTKKICTNYEGFREEIMDRTGLPLNPYFSASKIRFILDNIKDGQKKAENDELMAGTIDSWLIYKLTKTRSFVTDVSNASRTLLFNIKNRCWDDELLKMFNIPKGMLPEVRSSSSNFGKAFYFSPSLSICGVAGDQQASLFGHACFNQGDVKNTYGTGCFLLLNTGSSIAKSKNGLISTIGWEIDGKITYVLEGSVFIAGASVQWLRDEMGFFSDVEHSEKCAYETKDEHRTIVVPAFTGLGAPYWDSAARGAIFGLGRGTNKNDLTKATLEAIAFQSRDVFQAMELDTGVRINELCVDGGASKNNYLMQFQSDILGITMTKPLCHETTALGVCFLSGLKTGFFKDLNSIKALKKNTTVFVPKMNKKTADELYERWKVAVKATITFK